MKKLVVVLSVVLVLAFAGSVFAAGEGTSGHSTGTVDDETLNEQAKTPVSPAGAEAMGKLLGMSVDVPPTDSLTDSKAPTTRSGYKAAGRVAGIKTANLKKGRSYPLRFALQNLDYTKSSFAFFINNTVVPDKNYKLVKADDENGTNPVELTSFADLTNASFIFWIFQYDDSSNTGTGEIAKAAAPTTIEPEAYASDGGDKNPGSSGGGCVAGTSALALAVLGLFIAKGKK